MDLRDRLVLDPAVRSGKPTIRGTRITALDVLEYLAGGMTPDEILDNIRAVLLYAAERERRLFAAA